MKCLSESASENQLAFRKFGFNRDINYWDSGGRRLEFIDLVPPVLENSPRVVMETKK